MDLDRGVEADGGRRGARRAVRWGAAVGGLALALGGGTFAVIMASGPSAEAPKTAPATLTATPPVTGGPYQVAGFTSRQAAAATSNCVAAAAEPGAQGAVLRDAASGASGTTLVVTTPSSWTLCDESPNRHVTGGPFSTYASKQGWGRMQTPPAGDPAASWIMGPVELDSYGGGLVSRTPASAWVDVAVGRVATGVAKVSVQMPSGSTVTVGVQNGYFVAREVLASEPPVQSGMRVIPIVAYDSSGAVVYDSLRTVPAPSATAPPACYVTPSGQPVTPAGAPGQACLTATPW